MKKQTISLPNLGCNYLRNYVEGDSLVVEYRVRTEINGQPVMHAQALKTLNIFVPDDAPDNIVYRRIEEKTERKCKDALDKGIEERLAESGLDPDKHVANLKYRCDETGLEGYDFDRLSSTENYDPNQPGRDGFEEDCVESFMRCHGKRFGATYLEIKANVFAHLLKHPACREAYEISDKEQKEFTKFMLDEMGRELTPEESAALDKDAAEFTRTHQWLKKAFLDKIHEAGKLFRKRKTAAVQRNLELLLNGEGFYHETIGGMTDVGPILVKYDQRTGRILRNGNRMVMVGKFLDDFKGKILWKPEHYEGVKFWQMFVVPESFGTRPGDEVLEESFKRFNAIQDEW
jgi:hypothetical protein